LATPSAPVSAAAPARRRVALAAPWLLVLALLALRLPHLTGPLDDPHSWRQCDTIGYTQDFYRHGIDLLHPAVTWLGSHRTLVLEFPLTEAMAALLYHAAWPDPMWDRLLSLAFFGLATFHLHRIVRQIAGARPAWLATFAYLAMPLGQFYSRAAQPDFAATAFAHALLDHGLRAVRGRSLPHALAASLAGALAALIKSPYVLPVAPPLALALLAAPGAVPILLAAVAGAGPAIAFVLWRRHADAVNRTAPDWNFLPGYYKESNAAWWYFGTLAGRLDPASWIKVLRRLVFEVATPLGALLALVGLAGRAEDRGAPGARAFALAWVAGTLVYLAVFFPLNVIHSYYQIPFLAPAALLVGLGVDALWRRLPRLGGLAPAPLVVALFVLLAIAAVPRLGYYRIDWLRVEAGRLIAERVPPDDLVVASDHSAGYSDPRLLQRAEHSGWALAIPDLTPDRVTELARLGARWVAVVTDPEHPELVPPGFLDLRRVTHEPVMHGGHRLGTLDLYSLGGRMTLGVRAAR